MAPPEEGTTLNVLNDFDHVAADSEKRNNHDANKSMIGQSSHSATSSKSMSRIRHAREVPLVELELENVTYAPLTATAKERQKRKVVLDNVSTSIEPYKLSAWMGPSGSGKTSLISVAAGLIANSSDLLPDSIIKVNGEEGKPPKRLVGVVWQDDLLLSNLTVEETIYFSARLKTPGSVPDADVKGVVEETIAELGLTHVRDSLIGTATGGGLRGISGGERKRVAVAAELVVRPALLFLDEPTSGLDSTSAQALMVTLRELASMGHAIAVVIHQPRTAIFNLVDHLLLLSRGRTIFNGKACEARAFIESAPTVQPLPAETGIADWLMDTISLDEDRADGGALPKFWAENREKSLTPSTSCDTEAPTSIPPERRRRSTLKELNATPKFETSFWMQLKLLMHRTLKQQRGERLTVVAAGLTLAYLFFTCLFWWRIPDDTSRIFERNSLFFFVLIAQANSVVTSSITVFQRERSLLQRERAKKLYRVLPYFLAKTLSDMTNNVLLPCLYGVLVYWAANLRPTAKHFFQFLISYYMSLSTAQSMGLFLSIAIPSMQIALILAPPITLFFLIMGGFYIPYESMHVGIRWASWLSFARYGYTSLLINEFSGRDVPCAEGDVPISIGGSGEDSECPFPGDEVVAGLGVDGISTNFWFNVGIVLLFQVFFRVASYGLLVKLKR